MPAKLPFGLDAHRNFSASAWRHFTAGSVLGAEAVRSQSMNRST
jgi:hypothetical protein